MKKNEYMKPAMKVVALKQRSHLLLVDSVSNKDGLKWKNDGFEEKEEDY